MKTRRVIVVSLLGTLLGILLIASTLLFVAYQFGIFVPPIDIFGGMKTPQSTHKSPITTDLARAFTSPVAGFR